MLESLIFSGSAMAISLGASLHDNALHACLFGCGTLCAARSSRGWNVVGGVWSRASDGSGDPSRSAPSFMDESFLENYFPQFLRPLFTDISWHAVPSNACGDGRIVSADCKSADSQRARKLESIGKILQKNLFAPCRISKIDHRNKKCVKFVAVIDSRFCLISRAKESLDPAVVAAELTCLAKCALAVDSLTEDRLPVE